MNLPSTRIEKRTQQLDPPGSLNRAVTLLTAIARGSPQGSTLRQLVTRTSLPRPTIHRILNTLIALGWVCKNEMSTRYTLGVDLSALGACAIAHNPIERWANESLNRLACEIGEVLYLNIRSGMDMVCIGRYTNLDRPTGEHGWVGMRGPLGMTPGCIGMFTRMQRDEVHEVMESNLSRYYRIEGFNERAFRGMVTRAVEQGDVRYDPVMFDRTRMGVGVPICDSIGYPIAAIGMNYVDGTLDGPRLEACVNALRKVSGDIESKLNFLTSRPIGSAPVA